MSLFSNQIVPPSWSNLLAGSVRSERMELSLGVKYSFGTKTDRVELMILK